MKKEGIWDLFSLVLAIIFSVFLASQAFAQSIDAPIKKITHYAEQYEIGNINYAQLIVYMSSLRQDIAEEMGATSQGHDSVLKQEQLQKALGSPTETTKWVWVEGEEREKKLDEEVPAWRKIIFDGKKIQIWLNAWPHIVTRNNEELLFYRLNHDIIFKSPETQINIKEKIEEITSLAESYASNPSRDALEDLAKESVSVEQIFNNQFNRNAVKCEETMNDILGSENRRDTRKLLVQEINLFEGDNFEAILRIEYCDDCDWHWISHNLHFEARGRFPYPEENREFDQSSRERLKSLTEDEFKQRSQELVSQMQERIAGKDYKGALDTAQEFRVLTDAWNEKANNVWPEIEKDFRVDFESMTEEERRECAEDYCWIAADQKRIRAEKELREKNYEDRKLFYSTLFSSYDKKEFYYEQKEWEKRLVEEFKEFGEEICDNNIDDNKNNQVDCSEQQCGGKVCGYGTIAITDSEGVSSEKKVELYCVAQTCQAKEEIVEGNRTICGNHICEENEQQLCQEDCAVCPQYGALECSGNVIFSGKDENNCPLEPVCLAERQSCETDEDCQDPLCGDASCIEGSCQVAVLTECREPVCTDGQEKIQNCESGEEIVTETCIEGLWKETGVKCQTIPVNEATEEIEDITGTECTVKSDCGNENDVCSNGRCVTIPEAVSEETAKQETNEEVDEPLPSPEQQETQAEEAPITGNIIFYFFRTLITGFQVEGGAPEQTAPEPQPELSPENPPETIIEEQEDREQDEREQREEEEKERREQECNDRCKRECNDRIVRPYVEDCIREECGQELECNVDEVRVACENSFESSNEIETCESECSKSCLAGESTWIEPERRENKEERFVFTAGGTCRDARGRTEMFMWFGGWGEDFNDFHLIKNKYYSYGGADWCEQELKSLARQREELENSLNEEFAAWFFEKYVANSAEDWQEHISGIYEIYWKDVDLSRQIVERSQCLEKSEPIPYNLINFKYETEYGSVEFWEEIKTAKISEDAQEMQVISPYMRLWLFPSREFFKLEMKKAMESHKIPGPPEEENRNFLSEEQKNRLRGEIIDEIRSFNEEFGEHLVIQFKDFSTGEIAFNVYVRINEREIMYFEPMPYSEVPAEDVRIELDVNKLLDIIEYEESGRVELESPPWDKKPRVGFVKGATDGIRMYFMFRELINSARVSPESAESSVKPLTRLFFDIVMGGDERPQGEEDIEEGPEEDVWEDKEALTGQVIRAL